MTRGRRQATVPPAEGATQFPRSCRVPPTLYREHRAPPRPTGARSCASGTHLAANTRAPQNSRANKLNCSRLVSITASIMGQGVLRVLSSVSLNRRTLQQLRKGTTKVPSARSWYTLRLHKISVLPYYRFSR